MTPPQATTADAIALSARHIADVIGCAALVAYTATGSSAIRVARERPRCGVIGLTPFVGTARKLSLVWGVRSMVTDDVHNVEEMVANAEAAVRELGVADTGDRVAIIAGIPFGRAGKTNTIRVLRLE
jgi:pyruvate kinase